MHIWALHSAKGGVGKTAAAVNLAWEAARAGEHVLLWDLDPQAAASWYLQVDTDRKLAARKVVDGDRPLGRFVRRSAHHERLHAIPGDTSFRHMDALLRASSGSKKRLADLIEPFSETYTLVVLDCPPGLGSLASAVLRAADTVVVPVVPSPLSLRALDQIETLAGKEGRKAGRVQPFFSMVDRRKRLHRDMLNNPLDIMRDAPAAWIGYSADVERMGEYQAPVACFAPRSRAATQFRTLWRALA